MAVILSYSVKIFKTISVIAMKLKCRHCDENFIVGYISAAASVDNVLKIPITSLLSSSLLHILFFWQEAPFIMKKPQANALEGPSYMGYCIDILEKLQEHIDFKYHLYLVPDGQYGSRDPVSQQWDGIMREIIEQVMSVANMANIEHKH